MSSFKNLEWAGLTQHEKSVFFYKILLSLGTNINDADVDAPALFKTIDELAEKLKEKNA